MCFLWILVPQNSRCDHHELDLWLSPMQRTYFQHVDRHNPDREALTYPSEDPVEGPREYKQDNDTNQGHQYSASPSVGSGGMSVCGTGHGAASGIQAFLQVEARSRWSSSGLLPADVPAAYRL